MTDDAVQTGMKSMLEGLIIFLMVTIIFNGITKVQILFYLAGHLLELSASHHSPARN